jgi:hypothetical protein
MILLMMLSFVSVSSAINRIPWLTQLKTESAYVALLDPKKKLVPPFTKIEPKGSKNKHKIIFLLNEL